MTARDERGVAAVEFALILPVLLVLIMGGIEVGHMLYMENILQGEVERAARASSLESAATGLATIDARVSDGVHRIAPTATVDFQRRAYRSYQDIRKPEPFNDENGDRACNNGETFTDLNGNGHWDTDSGIDGGGTAREVLVYDISVQFQPLFPFTAHLFGDGALVMRTSTQLRNQPYSEGAPVPQTLTCP